MQVQSTLLHTVSFTNARPKSQNIIANVGQFVFSIVLPRYILKCTWLELKNAREREKEKERRVNLTEAAREGRKTGLVLKNFVPNGTERRRKKEKERHHDERGKRETLASPKKAKHKERDRLATPNVGDFPSLHRASSREGEKTFFRSAS